MRGAEVAWNDAPSESKLPDYEQRADELIAVVQRISLARSLEELQRIVRTAARNLTGADGATFVLRDGPNCFYVDEDAIEPLWKGRRFPLDTCISGWAMLNRRSTVIEDIYTDARVPHDAYRPTFVKSLVMVPIRSAKPVGAIGNYWAHKHRASRQEVRLLQALADSTSVAMENINLYAELEQRVRDRTAQLEAANRELEAFAYSASHDLRAPLRSIGGFAQMVEEESKGLLPEQAKGALVRVRKAATRMNTLIDALLSLSQVTRTELVRESIDLTAMAQAVANELKDTAPGREVHFAIEPNLTVFASRRLVRVLLDNLLGNAFKYTSRTEHAAIELGRGASDGTFFVADNGAGFDMQYAQKLFAPFGRLHAESEFAGTGIGLATVERIVRRHGGRVTAQSQPGQGARFEFSLTA